LEEVDKFTYLGSVIDKGGATADIRVRILKNISGSNCFKK
jgi:hypothetical protein